MQAIRSYFNPWTSPWTIIFASVFLVLSNFAWAEEDNTAYGLIDNVADGNTAFALELYAHQKKQKKNLFFSPYSLSIALAMTYAGARGNTAKQMSQVLRFPQNQDELHTAFKLLSDQINDAAGKRNNIEIRLANALWGQQQYSFLPNFKKLMEKYYQAKLKEVDFRKAYEAVRKEINAWVEQQTNNKIKKLIKRGVINKLTRLVLVNAIYFKGNWTNPFDKSNTVKAPFWVAHKKSVDVAMMNQKNYFGYMENDSLQALELSYGKIEPSYHNNNLSMIVLLPRTRNGLAKLESSLNVENLKTWLERLRWQKVKVSLPKFKINSGFELSKILSKMGMSDAFLRKANFSGINGMKNLSLSAVVHQAFVDVNEKGTEAAAATAAILTTRGLPPPTPTFRADHPFIFMIRHNLTGSILFMGRVVKP